MQDKYLKNAY